MLRLAKLFHVNVKVLKAYDLFKGSVLGVVQVANQLLVPVRSSSSYDSLVC
jgi:hypothetical protein